MTWIRLGDKDGLYPIEQDWTPVNDLIDEKIDLSPEQALLQVVAEDLGGERAQESQYSSHNKSYGD